MKIKKNAKVVTWFSAGAASAVTAKMMHDLASVYGFEHVVVRIHLDNEHEDNIRFTRECSEKWSFDIIDIRSEEYEDCWDVWQRRRYLAGINGAPCTLFLKKQVRQDFERMWFPDYQAFGFTMEETARADRFREQNPDVRLITPLIDNWVDKVECLRVLQDFDIQIPAMYRLGYRNNNCIGCVKGGAGYWNKIRVDFPHVFDRMAKLERDIGATLVKTTKNGKTSRVFLDELDPKAGRHQPLPDIECSLVCQTDDNSDS